MAKIKKIKGGFTPCVSEDEKLMATTNSRNVVYVYDLENFKLILQVKTVSNVSKVAISPDKKLLAAKNTQGQIAIISMETGEELCRNNMKSREGNQMTFTEDNKALLDFDWDGRTMLLDCETFEYDILDGPTESGVKKLPRVSHMQYDKNSNKIYKFIADGLGNSPGRVMATDAVVTNIDYKLIQEFPEKLPNHLANISMCKIHNYYVNKKNKEVVMTDKQFSEVKRFSLPIQVMESKHLPSSVWISPCEKFMFVDMGRQYDPDDFNGTFNDAKSLSYLFRLDTMELAQEFDYEYFSSFTMIDDDKRFVVATWQGTYIGEVD